MGSFAPRPLCSGYPEPVVLFKESRICVDWTPSLGHLVDHMRINNGCAFVSETRIEHLSLALILVCAICKWLFSRAKAPLTELQYVSIQSPGGCKVSLCSADSSCAMHCRWAEGAFCVYDLLHKDPAQREGCGCEARCQGEEHDSLD